MFVFTEKELGEAIKLEAEVIVVRGEDLVKKVLRIKNVAKVAWGLCLGGLGVAVGTVLAAPVVPVGPVIWTTLAGPVVVTTLGVGATKAAVLIRRFLLSAFQKARFRPFPLLSIYIS